MKKKLLALTMTAMLAASVSLSGCAIPTSTGSGSGEVVKIASVTPLSGSQAALGECVKNGAKMALTERIDEFKKLGINLQFSPQDDQADPKTGVTVAQKLVADKDTLGVVGHFNSGVAIPASEIYKTVNLVMVSPANTATPITDRKLPDVNRICTRDDVQGPAGADFAYKTLNAKTVFVIQDQTTYGQGVADQFKDRFAKDGGKVAGYEGITAGESDFSGVLNKVSSVKPDLVYFGGTYPEGSLIIKQMKDKGISAGFLGPDGMDSDEVIKIAGDDAKGIYYTTMCGDTSTTAKGKAWIQKYKSQFNQTPPNYAVYGYDSMNVILDGLKKAIQDNGNKKPTRDQVTKAVRATKGFQGIATNVTFDDKGDNATAEMFVAEFKEAKYPPTMVKTISAKDYLK